MPEPSGLKGLTFAPGYDSGDRALTEFYVPALTVATSYDRSVGYFRSSSLAVAARGMSRFIAGGGRVRMLVGAELTADDAAALAGAAEIPPSLADRLARSLISADEIEERRLGVLAWLVQQDRLEVRVAVALDGDGDPVVGDDVPYFHEKIGVMRDAAGDGVAFQGSVNETARAWTENFESFSVFTSWENPKHFDLWAGRFEQRWNGKVAGFRVFRLPEAVREQLLTYAPDEPPPHRDPEEPPVRAEPAILARYLEVAPRLPYAQRLAEETAPVTPFPHQSQVVERLAGMFPRSWLVADEVGLGKTISAGLSLRRLLLSGQVERALILAPANVAKQWQDELFEKFGLWVPRLDGGKLHGAHPDDVEPVGDGNPYRAAPILIASSHLARRKNHRRLVLDAAPWDLLVVDEAHHARRRAAANADEYRPSLLLELLDDLRAAGKLRTTWLLSATPMQVSAIELLDLLRQLALDGRLASWPAFQRFYAQLGRDDDDRVDWKFLARALRETSAPAPGPAEEALRERIRTKLGVVATDRIVRFHESAENPTEVAAELGPAGRAELREWIRLRSPIGQLVTRHSRETLKRYRDAGLLKEPIADRHVVDVPIKFSDPENQLYERLDGLIDRLLLSHGERRHAGFVLTIYRRRLTSSWAAIRSSLHKRVLRQADLVTQLDLDTSLVEDFDDEATEIDAVDEEQAVPLTDEDIAELKGYLGDLQRLHVDSKFEQLQEDIDAARSQGRGIIVFTQFTDTLISLRDRLVPAYRDHLATYTGQGGQRWGSSSGNWVNVSKQELVAAVQSRRVTVILANDAASEGLNLQAASYMVNFDLPWNPMRVEQRIGRIDRIGQQQPIIEIRNYVIPGTVEVDVFRALRNRIGEFHQVVGELQPILGAAERVVREAYLTGRDERGAFVGKQLEQLDDLTEELEASGVELVDEDPLPIPDHAPSPVTWRELHEALLELDVNLGDPGRPVTFDGAGSRDPSDWTAVGTYGHPRLAPALARHAALLEDGALVIRESGPIAQALRADRSPPEPVRRLPELGDLGEPHALNDAITVAETEAGSLAREQRARYDTMIRSSKATLESAIRSDFRDLIVETIAVRQALQELTTGEETDAALVLFDLKDEPGVLKYTLRVAESMGLSKAELLPNRATVNAYKGWSKPRLERQRTLHPERFAELARAWSTR